MKKFLKRFAVIGAAFAGLGPLVLCIVWFFLGRAGVIGNIPVGSAISAILSTTMVAFVAAGISQIYQIESMPMLTKMLVHCAVLYAVYVGMYLVNGWIRTEALWGFTLIFLGGFFVIWLVVYLCIKRSVDRINSKVKR